MSHTAEYSLHTPVRTPAHPGDQRVRTPESEEVIPLGLLVMLIVGASAVAAVAMAASSFTLAELGTAIGWTQWQGWLAWALPISVDLLAAVAGVAWLAKGVAPKARRLARTITLVAVATSVALNAVSHLVQSGTLKVAPWLVIAVSTVPPIVAAVGLHLVVTVARTARQQQSATRPLPLLTEPLTTPTVEAPAPMEPVTTPVTSAQTWAPAPAQPQPAPVAAELAPAYPAPQLAPGADWWHQEPELSTENQLAFAEEVRTPVTEVRTPVNTPDDQQEDDEQFEEEMTPERRREIILTATGEGLSQREAARRAACSPSYVRKVLDAA